MGFRVGKYTYNRPMDGMAFHRKLFPTIPAKHPETSRLLAARISLSLVEKNCAICDPWAHGEKLAMQFPTILIFERTKPALLAKEKHCCLIGILHIGVWNHPHITGWYNPVYTLNNQGFIHCSFRQLYCNIILWDGITACYSASGESLKTLFVWNKTMAKVAETVFKTNRPISGLSY